MTVRKRKTRKTLELAELIARRAVLVLFCLCSYLFL